MIKINLIQKAKTFFSNIPKPYGFSGFDSYNVNYDLFIEQAYNNPFIQAPFQEFVTDLKALKIEVRDKNGKKSESIGAKFVMNSLKRPNKELSYTDFIEYITIHLVFGGRCLLYKSPGVYKRDIQLYSPQGFTVYRNEMSMNVERIELGENAVTGDDLDRYHIIKTVNPSDAVAGKGSGYSKIKSLAMVGDMLNYLMIHNNSLLKNGGRTSGVYSLSPNTTAKDVEEIRRKFAAQNGASKAGTVAFIKGEGGSYTPFSTNPKDLDWVNGMVELQKIICRVMGIPETLILSENSSYNNLEGYKKKVYQDTVIPFMNKICEELTEFFKVDLEEGEEIVVNTSNIKALQIDIGKEMEQYAKALDGKITTNDFIKFINNAFELTIPLLKPNEGDRVLVSSNTMFLDEMGLEYDPTK
ncbi:MAG: phage portal protein [Fusobacteriaceae bacterium]